jgi:hypothetical protein
MPNKMSSWRRTGSQLRLAHVQVQALELAPQHVGRRELGQDVAPVLHDRRIRRRLSEQANQVARRRDLLLPADLYPKAVRHEALQEQIVRESLRLPARRRERRAPELLAEEPP